eukprot:4968778-Prymnesium_polylepis.1
MPPAEQRPLPGGVGVRVRWERSRATATVSRRTASLVVRWMREDRDEGTEQHIFCVRELPRIHP